MQKKGYSSPTIELIQLMTTDVLFVSVTVTPEDPFVPPIMTGRSYLEEELAGDGLNQSAS